MDLTGKFTFISPSVEKLRGFTVEEVMNQKIEEVISPGSQEMVISKIKKRISSVFGGESMSVDTSEVEQPCKDGTSVWTEVVTDLFYDESGKPIGIIGVSRDISERKKAQEDLIENERLLRASQEVARLGSYSWDLSTGLWKSSKILDDIFGIDEKYVRSLEGWENIIYSDYKIVMRAYFLNDVFGKLQRFDKEYMISRHDNGEKRWVHGLGELEFDSNNKPVKLFGTITDITERKQTEAQLCKLSSAVEQSPVSIVITDVRGNIEYVNPKFTEITGYSINEAFNQNPRLLKSNEHSNEFYKSLWDTILSGKNWAGVFHNKKKNGDSFWESAIISPIKSNSGEITNFVGIKEDITEKVGKEIELQKYREHLEEMVKERTDELDAANKLLKIEIEKQNEFELMLQHSLEKEKELSDMKSKFISTTSHEFRTPLTSVLSSAELLQRYAANWSDDRKNEHFKRIFNSIDYLIKLLDDVMTISRTETGTISYNPELIDLQRFSEECIQHSKPLMKKMHELKINFNSVKKDFKLDPKLMRFIFNNLLSNASKYSPDGGVIELSISSNEKNLFIKVRDEGIGIPPEEIGKIFDSFYRSKNADLIAGTGLGLAIVKRAVDLHNGEITVNSELNKGTTFIIRLPIN